MLLLIAAAAAAAEPDDLRVEAIAWAPDGSALYGGRGYGGVTRFDPATGKRLGTVFATPDDRLDDLAVDARGFVILGGTRVTTFDPDGTAGPAFDLPEDDGFRTGLALSPDGRRIAVGGCAARRAPVELYDRATGRRVASLEGLREDDGEQCAKDVAFVGSAVVGVGADGRAAVWRGGALEREWAGPGVGAEAVAASPDGRSIAVGGWADAGNVFDPATGRARWSFGFLEDTVADVDWSGDGRWLAVTWSGGGAVWDAASHVPVGVLPDAVGSVVFSPDSRRVAFVDRSGAPRVLAVEDLAAGAVTPRDRDAPGLVVRSPPGAGRWTSIAASRGFACGVRGGALQCWGDPSELRQESFPAQGGVARVVAGGQTVCTIDEARALRCFGSNSEGQAAPGGGAASTPGGPAVLTDVVDAAVGEWHTCAATEDGALWCWGLPDEGRLGGAPRGDEPGRVKRLSGVVDVEISGGTTCARTKAGEVWCFGANPGGVLGLPPDEADHAAWPVRVAGVAGARWLAVGDGVACAGGAGGTRCWGDPEAARAEPRVWLEGTGVARGGCGLRDGHLRCGGWAVRSEGVGDQDVAVDAVDVAFGVGFGCALDRAGVRWCWGTNERGELGAPVPAYRAAAAPVVGLTDAVDLAVGDDHACAVRKGGDVVCWGSGSGGALGRTDTADAPEPVPVPDLVGAVAIDADESGSCAAGPGGVRCWEGSRGGDAQAASAVTVGRRGVCAFAASGARCRLDDWDDGLPSGEVNVAGARFAALNAPWCVADGAGVKCGARDDLAGQGIVADRVPFGAVLDVGKVEDLDGSDDMTCVIEGGRPRCWGMGALVPLRWADDVRAVDIAVYGRVACIATPAGSAACLGTDDPAVATGWAEIPGVAGARKVGVGRDFACALSAAGTVVCWGDPRDGRLGDGTWTWTRRPVRAE